jgi:hypothetical protein
LIELEKLRASRTRPPVYGTRELAKQGLTLLTTEEGISISPWNPDGTKHGVYGLKSTVFDAVCNHDAIASVWLMMRGAQVYDKIASLPGASQGIISQYRDSMTLREYGRVAVVFGTWVNGGIDHL